VAWEDAADSVAVVVTEADVVVAAEDPVMAQIDPLEQVERLRDRTAQNE